MKTAAAKFRVAADRPIAIAILAMGGQGGGVLTDWIVALAEANGWYAQSTSVPGVAQRTGATLYYIEMLPAKEGRPPILSLMPTPGDVDIVLAAEWMEGGRAILRGLVTPDRTTLIASTHRAYAVAETARPGNAIANSTTVGEAADFAAKRTIAFDMDAVARAAGSVISAPLFGALAGASILPFAVESFEAVIAAGGKGAEASLRAFRAACIRAGDKPELPGPVPVIATALPAATGNAGADALVNRIRREFPHAAHAMLYAGLRRVVSFQDLAYGRQYLDRVADFLEHEHDRDNAPLVLAAAKYIAVAMSYDDVIAVADLKTRGSRFARLRRELGLAGGQIVYATEYFHPRAEEIAGLMPARLGAWIEASPRLFRLIDLAVNRGRRIETFRLGGFLKLYALAGLRHMRRFTLRHRHERAHLEAWLNLAELHAASNPALATEILNARRLVKGYADTRVRGLSKFDRVLSALPILAARTDGAQWLARLIAAALIDGDGKALDDALLTVKSLE
jgi:indolepyruvate ferredoxin oxidoreductase beta subunit